MTSQEERSRQVAEQSREAQWRGESFLKNLFLGDFRLELVHPFPDNKSSRPAFVEFYENLRRFLRDRVDPVAIDESGEYPEDVLDGLRELGAFGMKIPTRYGGLGLTHPEYVTVMKLLGSYDGNITALLSAHQAIGVPQPVKLFGSEELKQKYLPRCARGAISAFALTEPAVGSDPARIATVAEPSEDGTHYILNGAKLWCTNGTIAEAIIVIARNPRTDAINCFVVDMDSAGVQVEHRCRFMGLKALANAYITFENVRIPKENLVGEEGAGLKIALVTLNTGRLSLPAATSGTTKVLLEACRKWCNARVQWGVPIGKHEAIAHKLAELGTNAFAMEAVADLVADLADRDDMDIRLEAAAAKEWNTVTGYRAIDEALQIRGGRGYETERSLAARGEPPVAIERPLRDSRVNLIFEGSSEIMHLFMAREAVDRHLKVAGALVDSKSKVSAKLRALPKILLFYLWWYPTRWLVFSWWPRYSSWGPLARHVRFADRMSRKLARALFHAMVVHRGGLERRQALLFRAVDIAMELFVITAVVSRARSLRDTDAAVSRSAVDLADLAARASARRVRALFHSFWHNDDARAYRIGRQLLEGRYRWLEQGSAGVPYSVDSLTPPPAHQLIGRESHTGSSDASSAKSGKRDYDAA